MNLNSEGIIGLAQGSSGGSYKQGTLYMDSLKEAGAIDHKVFAFLISAEGHKRSIFTVGGVETKKYAKGPMQWHPLATDSDMWEINMKSATFGGTPILDGYIEPALVDTGTSYISLPISSKVIIENSLINKYGFGERQVGHTGNWMYECTSEQYDQIAPL